MLPFVGRMRFLGIEREAIYPPGNGKKLCSISSQVPVHRTSVFHRYSPTHGLALSSVLSQTKRGAVAKALVRKTLRDHLSGDMEDFEVP